MTGPQPARPLLPRVHRGELRGALAQRQGLRRHRRRGPRARDAARVPHPPAGSAHARPSRRAGRLGAAARPAPTTPAVLSGWPWAGRRVRDDKRGGRVSKSDTRPPPPSPPAVSPLERSSGARRAPAPPRRGRRPGRSRPCAKIGASLSLFTAAISLAPATPTVCWIWPETPTARYRSGAVLAPERPMMRSSPSHSKSARLLVQPTTAPSAAASWSPRARSSRALQAAAHADDAAARRPD